MFDPTKLSLLDRGIGVAIAHIRGGGELGRRWYEDGRRLNKMNTFHDFITVAKYLKEHHFASEICALGASAGGLLMGAIHNMAPELFRAIVAEVPYVDCINTMLDPSLPLVVC